MSEPAISTETTVETPAPAVQVTPETVTPAPADDQNPPWLSERLKKVRQQERKALLESIGESDPDSLKKKLARLTELETAQLSDKERSEQRIKELETAAEKASKVTALNGELTEFMFSQLPELTREAITETAGEDPAARWSAMKMMAKAGLLQMPQMGVPQAQPPKPAQTAPNAPAPPKPGNADSMFSKWERMKSSDPTSAALFYRLNSHAIEQSRGK